MRMTSNIFTPLRIVIESSSEV